MHKRPHYLRFRGYLQALSHRAIAQGTVNFANHLQAQFRSVQSAHSNLTTYRDVGADYKRCSRADCQSSESDVLQLQQKEQSRRHKRIDLEDH